MGYWATRRGDYGNHASTMKRISCVALQRGCHLLEQTPTGRIVIQHFRVNRLCLN